MFFLSLSPQTNTGIAPSTLPYILDGAGIKQVQISELINIDRPAKPQYKSKLKAFTQTEVTDTFIMKYLAWD